MFHIYIILSPRDIYIYIYIYIYIREQAHLQSGSTSHRAGGAGIVAAVAAPVAAVEAPAIEIADLQMEEESFGSPNSPLVPFF